MDSGASWFSEGPLGRAYLASLAGLESVTTGFRSGGRPYTDHQNKEQARVGTRRTFDRQSLIRSIAEATIDESLVQSLTRPAAMRRLGEILIDFAVGSTAAWRQAMSVDVSWAPLVPVAEVLAESPAVSWWGQPVDRVQQYWRPEVGEDGRSLPTMGSLAESRAEPGIWWSELISPGVLSSCRGLETDPVVTVNDICHDDHRLRRSGSSLRSATVSPGARVYEIASIDDWTRFISTYPAVVSADMRPLWSGWSAWSGQWVEPDWPRVAVEWDGVHMTIGGYLAAAYQRLASAAGSTMLAGWDPDATVWLSPTVLQEAP